MSLLEDVFTAPSVEPKVHPLISSQFPGVAATVGSLLTGLVTGNFSVVGIVFGTMLISFGYLRSQIRIVGMKNELMSHRANASDASEALAGSRADANRLNEELMRSHDELKTVRDELKNAHETETNNIEKHAADLKERDAEIMRLLYDNGYKRQVAEGDIIATYNGYPVGGPPPGTPKRRGSIHTDPDEADEAGGASASEKSSEEENKAWADGSLKGYSTRKITRRMSNRVKLLKTRISGSNRRFSTSVEDGEWDFGIA